MSDISNNYGNLTSEQVSVFFRKVYTYMFIALAISGTVAYIFGTDKNLFSSIFFNAETQSISFLFYVVVFSPLILGLIIQRAFMRLSMELLTFLFVLYSILMGLSLSTIFMVYEMGAIAWTFLVTSGAFAGMAVLGYTTKTDLTKFGSLLYMVFIGMFLASIVNLFMQNDSFGFIISCLGVFVFTGLTAYHMQNLKQLAESTEIEGEAKTKLALIGGLQLYILFVNLFLSLLRILGGRR